MKKIIVLVLCAMIYLTPFSISTIATDSNINYGAGSGEFYTMMEVVPFIENGHTFLPIRYVAEAFGIFTMWDNITKTATLERGAIMVRLTIGSRTISIAKDGFDNSVDMDVTPMVKDGRTLVPVRFVAEAFGLCVEYGSSLYFKNQQQILISEGGKELYLTIGEKTLYISSGHFQQFHESDNFRFAYPIYPNRDDPSTPFPNLPTTEYINMGENAISIRVPSNVWGTPGCIITVSYESVVGKSFADMNLKSVIDSIDTQYTTIVNDENTTVGGFSAIAYKYYLVTPASCAISGVAFFYKNMLMRFEVSIDMENITVQNPDEWGLAYATSWLSELLPSLIMK